MKISPTPIERAMGRLMRAPDGHDGGDGGDNGGDAGGGGQDADTSGSGAGGDAGDEGDQSTVLGGAGADEGAGGSDDSGSTDGEGGEADDGADGKGEVPEAYDLKLTLTEKDAEGKDVEVAIEMDKELVEKASPVLKGLKLSNDQANQLVALVPEIQQRVLQSQADEHKAMTAQWARDAEKDPEIGQAKWKETQALAAKALDHFGAPKGSDFRKLLDDTGLGNHPVMIAMFRKVGASVKEDDKLERDTTNPQGKKDRLETLYPDDVPKK